MRHTLANLLTILFLSATFANAHTWHSASAPVSIEISAKHDKVVEMATNMFCEDMAMITTVLPQKVKKNGTLILVQLDKATMKQQKQLRLLGVDVDRLLASTDGFAIKENGGKIYAIGNNGRGTAYALLELSRMAGVSPWVWWGDNKPETKQELTIDDGFYTIQTPSIERRGIFINDEDWSLLPWSHSNHDAADGTFECAVKGRKCKRIGAKTYKELFKLMLRLRANMLWPAMHEQTVPFYQVDGAMEVADSCGIIIGTSHCEPLMRNNTTEWSIDKRGAFNYLTNKEQVQDYWIQRLKETAGKQNVYTIGMRGIHDGSMEGPKTLEEKTFWLQKVIDDQREMLAKYVSKSVTDIPQAFVPYKEVLEIYENGLQVPDDVMLVWCDDNYGYLTRLPDAEQQKRSGGHGLYYHLSYWGRPHSYLWLTNTQPGLIYNELREAYEHNVRKQWIFNIHDPKIAAFDLELALNLAWQFENIKEEGLDKYTEKWFAREFGEENAKDLSYISRELFRLAGIRKPEFMGWNQIELDKKKVPGGKSPITNTEFSFTEFGNEAEQFIADYNLIVEKYDNIESIISENKRDALFSALGYRLKAGAAFSEKLLKAQFARELDSIINAGDMTDLIRKLYIAAVQKKSEEINVLNARWNSMQGGKWKGLMDSKPQQLPVFMDVPLPYTLSKEEADSFYDSFDIATIDPAEDSIPQKATAWNACDYSRASAELHPVKQLGHSMNAVPLPKGEWMEYDIDMGGTDSLLIRIAVIPTQANDRGDIRFAVGFKGEKEQIFSLKEPYRSERWKQNVLRGQSIRTLWVKRPKDQKGGALRVKALDDHIIVDQLMLDTNPKRKFYMFPTKGRE